MRNLIVDQLADGRAWTTAELAQVAARRIPPEELVRWYRAARDKRLMRNQVQEPRPLPDLESQKMSAARQLVGMQCCQLAQWGKVQMRKAGRVSVVRRVPGKDWLAAARQAIRELPAGLRIQVARYAYEKLSARQRQEFYRRLPATADSSPSAQPNEK